MKRARLAAASLPVCVGLLLLHAPAPRPARAISRLAHLPLRFEPNTGQAGAEVRFLARAAGYTTLLTTTEAVLVSAHAAVRLKLEGANPNLATEGVDELPGKSNYFIGNDPIVYSQMAGTFRCRTATVSFGLLGCGRLDIPHRRVGPSQIRAHQVSYISAFDTLISAMLGTVRGGGSGLRDANP